MTKNKKTLVLGATTKPERYAIKAVSMLVDKGHSVLALGQNAGEVAGVKIQTKAIPLKNIDTVTLYLNPARQKDYYNYIVEAQPKRVIFNALPRTSTGKIQKYVLRQRANSTAAISSS